MQGGMCCCQKPAVRRHMGAQQQATHLDAGRRGMGEARGGPCYSASAERQGSQGMAKSNCRTRSLWSIFLLRAPLPGHCSCTHLPAACLLATQQQLVVVRSDRASARARAPARTRAPRVAAHGGLLQSSVPVASLVLLVARLRGRAGAPNAPAQGGRSQIEGFYWLRAPGPVPAPGLDHQLHLRPAPAWPGQHHASNWRR